MIHKLAYKIAYIFVRHGESTENNVDIYAYAVEAVIALLLNFLICIVISLLFGRVIEGIIFITIFAVFRRFTGGYHANSHLACVLTFSIILMCAMMITSFISEISISFFITSAIAIIAWLGIFTLAPIDDKNRHYEGERRAILKKKSIAVSTLLLIICTVVGFSLSIYIALIIALAMFSVFGSMVYALVRNRMT